MHPGLRKQVSHYAPGTVRKGKKKCVSLYGAVRIIRCRTYRYLVFGVAARELTSAHTGSSGFPSVEAGSSLPVSLFVNGFVPIQFFVFVYEGFVQGRIQDKGG